MLDITWISCLAVNPITVYSYGCLFKCTTVDKASDSMTALAKNSKVIKGKKKHKDKLTIFPRHMRIFSI